VVTFANRTQREHNDKKVFPNQNSDQHNNASIQAMLSSQSSITSCVDDDDVCENATQTHTNSSMDTNNSGTETDLGDLARCAFWHSLVQESNALDQINLHHSLAEIPILEMKRLMNEFGPEQYQLKPREAQNNTSECIRRKFRRWFPRFFHWFYYSYKKKCWIPRYGDINEKKRRELRRIQSKAHHADRNGRKFGTWRQPFIVSEHVAETYNDALAIPIRQP
jgi:hypothetical protein